MATWLRCIHQSFKKIPSSASRQGYFSLPNCISIQLAEARVGCVPSAELFVGRTGEVVVKLEESSLIFLTGNSVFFVIVAILLVASGDKH